MNSEYLSELLAEVTKRGGGLVLNQGEVPTAVVLSVEKYYQLLNGTLIDMDAQAQQASKQTNERTILVTGGAGYVGGHVARELLDAGFTVVVLDNLHAGRKEHVPLEAIFIEGDVRDINLLRDIFAQRTVDAVVHLAALLEVEESVANPDVYFDVNTVGTINLAKVMREAGVTSIVFSSTAAVYGLQGLGLIPETAECKPNSPYGASKLLAEQALLYFSTFGNLQVTVLRFFNVAGKHSEWDVNDTHTNSHLIPIVLSVARGEKPVLTVNGSDYSTFDGTCVRDYVHVLDIAKAHVAALNRSTENQYTIYNVGTGHGASVREVVQAAAEITGHMIPMEIGPRRPGDDAQTVADCAKIAKELGFKAEHSSLEEIIANSWTS